MNLGRWLRAALLCTPLAAAAQTPLIEPSVALGCLTPAREQRGVPEYPFDAWKRDKPGRVQVELEFSGPATRPSVTVLSEEGDGLFVDAVKAHVRQFRIPCLAGTETRTRLVFDYVFKPDARKVVAADPVDPDDVMRRRMMSCLTHTSGKEAPEYPTEGRRRNLQGRFLLNMTFIAPDKPPVVKVYSSRNRGVLHDTIKDWAEGYRMPCFTGEPVQAAVTFVYLMQGSSAYGFKEVTLQQFLSFVRGIKNQRVDFDFTAMGCPFDVRLQYLRPHQPNFVGQLEDYSAERKPFTDWLKNAELELTGSTLDSVYADMLTVHVPCGSLHLDPQT